jgi:photosystem II stability/assembly factor-like uncharacterized protein
MGEWTTSGPPGISRPFQFLIHPLDPQLLYAATLAGLYQSRDGGTSFHLVNSKPALAVGLDPGSTNRLFFASSDGFYASIDAGATWILRGPPISTDPPFPRTYYVQSLVVEAGGGRLYVVTSLPPFTGIYTSGTVFASSDGGASWTALLGSGLVPFVGVAIHPTDSSQLFAFPYAGGVLKSTDRGQTWTTVLSRPWVNSFAISRTDPVAIYVAFGGGGIFRSLDSGQNWSEADNGIPNPLVLVVGNLVLAPSTPTLLVQAAGSTYRTTDGGATWGAFDLAGTNPLAFDPLDSSVLYGTFRSDLRKSQDGGQSWRRIGTGLAAVSLSSIATGAGPVYAGGTGDVFQSTDKGVSWSGGREGLPENPVMDLAVDAANSRRLFAAVGTGLFSSNDAGATWALTSFPFLSIHLSSVAIAPSAPQIVYASTSDKAFRSDDSGFSWTPLSPSGSAFDRLVVDPNDPNTLYVAGGSVPKSVDGGVTWGMPTLPSTAYDLAIDPRNPSVIYAASLGGVFKSSDGGSTWAPSSNGLSGILRSIVVDPITPSRLYVATSLGVYRSIDAGDLWQAMPFGLSAVPSRLAIDPTGLVLYAATNRGVFQFELTPDAQRKTPARPRPPVRTLVPRS